MILFLALGPLSSYLTISSILQPDMTCCQIYTLRLPSSEWKWWSGWNQIGGARGEKGSQLTKRILDILNVKQTVCKSDGTEGPIVLISIKESYCDSIINLKWILYKMEFVCSQYNYIHMGEYSSISKITGVFPLSSLNKYRYFLFCLGTC